MFSQPPNSEYVDEDDELVDDHLPWNKLHDSPAHPETPHHLPAALIDQLRAERRELRLDDKM